MTTTNDIPALQGNTLPLKGIRRAAARQMVAAWQAPAFHLTVEVDMTKALTVKSVSPQSTVTDRLISAAATALQENPGLNAHYSEEGVTTFEDINIGIAVATDAGLTVPVIHGVPALGLPDIAQRRREVVEKARARKLGMADISAGTFTISNLGMLGIDRFDAILNVPQVAILAVASTRQRYVVRDGQAEWRPIAELTLTCDHRAVDGSMGAVFLKQLKELIEAPIPAP
ncbi:dihydrolipoamide acetyltransferase family protein [Arthrobacter globiformis]|uniref:dihydrolipoamide acetyltransferase family protein n=1 Tax=Arthrobacter globiformis TaxID=1665 RepID=UPI0027885E66|nr:dihydrolipoamide acetyltransferase family protein [Arthrobacter globiformis]MDQ0864559.1 pyruvate dehydrogenase E2 component (dihydrolipoamide acetyltransferase) [Arthrobacter globiformis]